RRPGIIMEFGTWWGANLALFASLRAVYEPYNYTRRIVGFDTFSGYPPPTAEDGTSEFVASGRYAVDEEYLEHLRQVLDFHEAENPLGHIRKYELVPGDASNTVAAYLADHPETVI